MRDALLQSRSLISELPVIAGLIGLGAAFVPVGLWLFALAEARAKRLGTLKRSG